VQSTQKGLLMDNTVSLDNEGMQSIKLFGTIKIGPIIPDDDTLNKWTWGTGSADQYQLKDQAMIWEPHGDNPCGNFIRRKDTPNRVRINPIMTDKIGDLLQFSGPRTNGDGFATNGNLGPRTRG
jgi:hypothetical protein